MRVAAIGRSGQRRHLVVPDRQPGRRRGLLGSRTRDEVFAAISGTGNVVIAAVGHDDCGRVVPVPGTGSHDFGPLVQSGPFLFAPDRATGTVSVIDTRRDTIVGSFPLVEPERRLELVAKDGFVFYNDLDGETVGVLTFRGGSWSAGEALRKVRPGHGRPGDGIPTWLRAVSCSRARADVDAGAVA